MAKILCCFENQEALLYEVKPDKESFDKVPVIRQLVAVLPMCYSCRHTRIQAFYYDKDNELLGTILIKKKPHKYVAEMKIIKVINTPNIKAPVYPNSKHYLHYSDKGRKKRCYSNLSTMEVGKQPLWDEKLIPLS